MSQAAARGFQKRGLRHGERIGILSANRVEFLTAFTGALRAGLVAVPINYKFSPEVISFICRDANLKLMFHDAAREGRVPGNLPTVCFDETFEDFLDSGEFDTVRPEAADEAMVLYTSGSTGRPKGVPLTHRGHIWALKGRMLRGWPFVDHRLLIAAPLYHMNALCTSLFGLSASTSSVLLPEFDARQYLSAIDRYRCSWITSVPTMLAMAFAEADLMERLDLSSVKIVRMGSAPISPKLWDKVRATFPDASITNGYGTTEAGPIVFGAADGQPLPPLSVGRVMPDVDVKLIDHTGREADQGELWHRTQATMTGYLNLPEKTAEVLTDDGWYKSGDVFRRDGDGNYFFVGRTDDMFVCGGENIYPSEVESVLVGHPDVEESCVVPVPDDIKGHKPVAFVVPRNGAVLTEGQVKQHALARAPAYQHPRMVIFLDKLPLAGPGKVDRNGLQAQAEKLWQTGETKSEIRSEA